MYCKWCGMDSKETSRCEWCGRPFAAADEDATTAVPQATTAVPQATRKVPQATTAVPQATTAMPPLDGDDPTAALPYSPRISPLKRINIEVTELPPLGIRFEKYLSVMLLLLAPGMLSAHYFSEGMLWLIPFLTLGVASGFLLASFRVIGYYDDEFADVLIYLVVTALIGPIYAAGVYLIVGLIKQDINWSMLGIIASFVVVRFAIGAAALGLEDTFASMAKFASAGGANPASFSTK